MQQYLELLRSIKQRGTIKPAARPNMPSTISLFGYQFRHNLQEGFPLLTTKKVSFKNIVVELLWFLSGSTNIKYLIDNGVNIWNEDAYNYYVKKCKEQPVKPMEYEDWIICVKDKDSNLKNANLLNVGLNYYTLGDCGYQYGKVWRMWEKYFDTDEFVDNDKCAATDFVEIDQIARVILSLRTNPESRRHIVTAIDPAHDEDLALYWCHSMFQFNCRPISYDDRIDIAFKNGLINEPYVSETDEVGFTKRKAFKIKDLQQVEEISKAGNLELYFDSKGIPKYYLDCQLYQRSADVFLGVPYNIASYALLTHIIARMNNMIAGEFVHTFGDVHIYENHMDAVNEQLKREPLPLPKLYMNREPFEYFEAGEELDNFFLKLDPTDFQLQNYKHHPAIKAELSTGLIK